MLIGMAQINPTLGDFQANAEKILQFTRKSQEHHCRFVVFPEACLLGYNPLDLLEVPSLVSQQEAYLSWLAQEIPKGVYVLVGAMTQNPSIKGPRFHNSAVGLESKKTPVIFSKQLLPTYDVFDERRHVAPGELIQNVFQLDGYNILVTLCEDIWAREPQGGRVPYAEDPLEALSSGCLDLIVNLSASPFTRDKVTTRLRVARKVVQSLQSPLVYVNLVGGQDELIFDGGSFTLDSKGEVISQSVYFEEALQVCEIPSITPTSPTPTSEKETQRCLSPLVSLQDLPKEPPAGQEPTEWESSGCVPISWVRRAIVLGIKDFVRKTGFQRVHLGLSGGVDSALVVCLAVEALGPHRVTALALPTPFNSENSLKWAQKLALHLDIRFEEWPIWDSYQSVLKGYETWLGPVEFGVMHENIQSRLRGLFLMAYSNEKNSLLLNTSNKSELAMGYSTLYGDMCGGLCPIGDLLKKDVYALCHSYNYNESNELIIPKEIIERPPSAELRPNQKDEDHLPCYLELDESLHRLVEKKLPAETKRDREVLRRLYQSEFKRWQSPPILKVTTYGFGRGRRFPIAGKFPLGERCE